MIKTCPTSIINNNSITAVQFSSGMRASSSSINKYKNGASSSSAPLSLSLLPSFLSVPLLLPMPANNCKACTR